MAIASTYVAISRLEVAIFDPVQGDFSNVHGDCLDANGDCLSVSGGFFGAVVAQTFWERVHGTFLSDVTKYLATGRRRAKVALCRAANAKKVARTVGCPRLGAPASLPA